MTIREYAENDFNGVCDLIKNELGYQDINSEELAERLRQMQNAGGYKIIVAEENDSIIGFVGCHLGLAFEISGKVMRIIALAVKSDLQGKGVGARLVAAAELFAQENGVTVIGVNSGVKREHAHRFYEKQGFSRKGYSFTKKI